MKREFRVGNLYINRKITGALVDRQPFGGFKLSGIGSKAGGPDYLLQFVLPRTITENTLRRGFAPTPNGAGIAASRLRSAAKTASDSHGEESRMIRRFSIAVVLLSCSAALRRRSARQLPS